MPSCAICGFKASSDKLLRMHIQAKHDERVLKCEKCEVTCKGGRKLQTHMESHRKVNCKHCDKTILYNSRNSHTIKCVGEKKAFKCENCPATFNKADNLKVHMANKRCSVQCNLCEKTLQSEFYLEKHISSTANEFGENCWRPHWIFPFKWAPKWFALHSLWFLGNKLFKT